MQHKGTYRLLGSLVFLLCFTAGMQAQLFVAAGSPGESTSNWEIRKQYPDTASLRRDLADKLDMLQSQGFLSASVDSVKISGDTAFLWLFTGKRYYWADVLSEGIPPAWLGRDPFSIEKKKREPISLSYLESLRRRVLDRAMSTGYPFSTVFLDSVSVSEDAVTARLILERGPLIRFGELNPLGEVKISAGMLRRYLEVEEGAPYDQGKVVQINKRLRDLPYIRPLRGEKIRFVNNKAHVDLFLEKRPNNRFDFLLGVLPNSGPDQKTRLTGTFLADLNNQFGQGERLFISFEQFKAATQRLDLNVRFPFLPGMPFGIDGNFELYKRDSTWLDVQADLGVLYLLGGTHFVKAFWETDRTTLLRIDERAILASRMLPGEGDLHVNAFGVEWFYQDLDYIFNPRRGWEWTVRASGGFKQLRKNNDILALTDPDAPQFDFESLYEDRTLKSNEYRFRAQVNRYWPLGVRATLLTRVRARGILSDNTLFRNEQLLLGGNQLMRGFDEESIFATAYGVGTVEYRILTGENGFLALFQDIGFVRDKSVIADASYWLWGFGAGLSFQTNIGIFSLNYALGKREAQTLDMRNGKVHFGYLSLF